MTDPDPHTFAVSRRALREPPVRSTTDTSTMADAPITRRAHRAVPAPQRSTTPTVQHSTRRTMRSETRSEIAPHAIEVLRSPSALRRRTGIRTTDPPVPFRPAEPVDADASSSPIWESVARRSADVGSAGRPTADPASQSRATHVEAGGARRSQTDDEAPSLTRFVMPPRVVAKTDPGMRRPAVFRAPPPPLPPARLEPLLAPLDPAAKPIRHARRRSLTPIRLGGAAAVAAAAVALVLSSSVAVTAAVTGTPVETIARNVVSIAVPAATTAPTTSVRATVQPPAPAPIEAPAPEVIAEPVAVDPCTTPAMTTALQSGDDTAAIAAMGGAEALRAAVAGGTAPCIDLGDPSRVWVVVDKTRPLDPIDFVPASLTTPDGVRGLEGGQLRADAASALIAMVSGAGQAGVGEIALQSAYRSYDTQVTSYGNQVSDRGTQGAELVSARPGYSEHQSGLAADIVPCDGECGTFDDLAASVQGQWVAAHSWEYGWIVRYEAGHTGVTGYSPEPWHLRYIGVDLARAYHAGGWHTLEEFFGLPAAPDYAD